MAIHPVVKSLIEEINAFRDRTQMSKTAFGLLALNDPGFIPDLSGGTRVPSLKTMDKVRAFMRERERSAA